MSYNSNLGYADLNPYVGGQFVNSTNSQYAGSFGSNETQGGSVCNDAMMRGGGKGKGTKSKGKKWKESIRRKIKNITIKYKKMAKKRSKSMRKRLHSRYSRNTKSKTRNMKGGWMRKHRKSSDKKRREGAQNGGYAQYGSNMPFPSSYSVGGNLPPNLVGLASPPPFAANAAEVDNYNHFTNQGVSSPGN